MFRPKQILIIGLLAFALLLLNLSTNAQLTPAQIDSLNQGLAKAKDTSRVSFLITLGYNASDRDVKKAIEYGQEALDISNKFHYTFGIGRASYLLAYTIMNQGDFNKSDSLLRVAENSFIAVNHKTYLMETYDSRGSWNFMQGNYWEAADF